ncbi:MAG: DapH/DapD/GlmU-related protein [Lachnospira sp.]
MTNIKLYIQKKIFQSVEKIRRMEQNAQISKMNILGSIPYHRGDVYIEGAKYVTIGDGAYIGRDVRIEALDSSSCQEFSPILCIGDGFSIGDYSHIGCVHKIIIGDGVLVGSKVLITDHNHGNIVDSELSVPPAQRPLSFKQIIIGNNVWIGDNVTILPGVNLGDNVIIGANSVVTHSFPANVVIAGVPATIIRCLGGE